MERNLHRPRQSSTKADELDLKIPKVRKSSFFPTVSCRDDGSTTAQKPLRVYDCRHAAATTGQSRRPTQHSRRNWSEGLPPNVSFTRDSPLGG